MGSVYKEEGLRMQGKYSSKENLLRICRPEQLWLVVEDATVTKVVLQISALVPDEIAYWENKLNREVGACGCSEGAAFLLITLFSLAFLILEQSPLLPNSAAGTGLLCMTLAIVSIGVGKTFGLFLAKQRLKRAVFDLSKVLTSNKNYFS